jgi:DnaJ homologue, subfamily C, member 28, conserved domain
MGYESWVDRQIREAEERGAFDDLPGAGKPLKNLDRHDPDWWVKDLVAREQLSLVLPTSLALRKEVEDLPTTLAGVHREQDVRELVDDLNERIVEARRRPTSGPPVFIKTVDVEAVVADWREARRR